MVDECYCNINAYSLKGMCECKTICLCDCEGCDCKKNRIDIWVADSNVSVICSSNIAIIFPCFS